MRKRNFKVLGLGQCCRDYIGKIVSYPSPDTKCEFSDMVVQGGGPVATALVDSQDGVFPVPLPVCLAMISLAP